MFRALLLLSIFFPSYGFSQTISEDITNYTGGEAINGLSSSGLNWNGNRVINGNTTITTMRYSNGKTITITKTKLDNLSYQVRVDDGNSVKYYIERKDDKGNISVR